MKNIKFLILLISLILFCVSLQASWTFRWEYGIGGAGHTVGYGIPGYQNRPSFPNDYKNRIAERVRYDTPGQKYFSTKQECESAKELMIARIRGLETSYYRRWYVGECEYSDSAQGSSDSETAKIMGDLVGKAIGKALDDIGKAIEVLFNPTPGATETTIEHPRGVEVSEILQEGRSSHTQSNFEKQLDQQNKYLLEEKANLKNKFNFDISSLKEQLSAVVKERDRWRQVYSEVSEGKRTIQDIEDETKGLRHETARQALVETIDDALGALSTIKLIQQHESIQLTLSALKSAYSLYKLKEDQNAENFFNLAGDTSKLFHDLMKLANNDPVFKKTMNYGGKGTKLAFDVLEKLARLSEASPSKRNEVLIRTVLDIGKMIPQPAQGYGLGQAFTLGSIAGTVLRGVYTMAEIEASIKDIKKSKGDVSRFSIIAEQHLSELNTKIYQIQQEVDELNRQMTELK